MNGVSHMRKYAKEEICEDIMIKILDFLPSKCLAKFKCVSKCWEKYIADCRCRRWIQKPYLVGFFCQHSEIQRELRFFLSSSSTKDHSGTFVGSLDHNLFHRKARLVAASNGFLLCNVKKVHYYVYNPATSQFLVLPKTQICMEDDDNNPPPVGFICKVDNPDNKDDIISFTIVRYAIPLNPSNLQFAVTIESFSSETNVWTANKITLEVPIRLFPCTFMKSPSASVIDGVFYWYDDSLQITVYDSIHKSFWDLKLPEDMERGIGCGYLGSSAGGLYFALNIIFKGTVIVWYLASNIRNRDAVWVKKYVGNVRSIVLQCPEDFGVEGYPHIELNNMVIHPTVPHIFYLGFQRNIISYDFEKDVAQLVNIFSGGPTMKRYKLFPFEWYQWPRRLL
ncbi:F-box protein At5g03970-like [Solanum tuberosum]|uniref:F-box domain containing protein n=1 Tax=Solanum tuberosum TaxID=4113 RepID=M1DFM1_SOLTU|nr:PREDICTED: F-box protein At5g03970-like [Solanum tuberosum]